MSTQKVSSVFMVIQPAICYSNIWFHEQNGLWKKMLTNKILQNYWLMLSLKWWTQISNLHWWWGKPQDQEEKIRQHHYTFYCQFYASYVADPSKQNVFHLSWKCFRFLWKRSIASKTASGVIADMRHGIRLVIGVWADSLISNLNVRMIAALPARPFNST